MAAPPALAELGVTGAAPILLMLPFLVAAAMGVLRSGRLAARVDRSAGVTIVLLACVTPLLPGTLLPFDRVAALAVPLLALGWLARHWQMAARLRRPPLMRSGAYVVLGGSLLAALPLDPLLSWVGLTMAATAALFAGRRDRLPGAGLGLSLILFGLIATPEAPVLVAAIQVLGLAVLGGLVPELASLLLVLLLRLALAGDAGPAAVAVGLAGALACGAWGLGWRMGRRPIWLGLGQAGLIATLFGLGGAAAVFAGLVQLILLALGDAALVLGREEGPDRMAALAGLAGLPPFGLFPGLALGVLVVAQRNAWLLLPYAAAIALLGWAAILRLPSPRRDGQTGSAASWLIWLAGSPAWLPLAASVLVGWLLPDAAAIWLRGIAVP